MIRLRNSTRRVSGSPLWVCGGAAGEPNGQRAGPYRRFDEGHRSGKLVAAARR